MGPNILLVEVPDILKTSGEGSEIIRNLRGGSEIIRRFITTYGSGDSASQYLTKTNVITLFSSGKLRRTMAKALDDYG